MLWALLGVKLTGIAHGEMVRRKANQGPLVIGSEKILQPRLHRWLGRLLLGELLHRVLLRSKMPVLTEEKALLRHGDGPQSTRQHLPWKTPVPLGRGRRSV